MSWLYMSSGLSFVTSSGVTSHKAVDQISLVWQQRSPIGKSQAMNRRLFYVVTAILVALTVYMVSINLNKLPDERPRAPRNYIKEDKPADVKLKGRNPLFWEAKITSLFRCWLKIVFPSGKLFILLGNNIGNNNRKSISSFVRLTTSTGDVSQSLTKGIQTSTKARFPVKDTIARFQPKLVMYATFQTFRIFNDSSLRDETSALLCLKGHCHAIWQLCKKLEGV